MLSDIGKHRINRLTRLLKLQLKKLNQEVFMPKLKQIRQGDVFMEWVAELPKGAKPIEQKVVGPNLIVAEGGESIHAHVMEEKDVKTYVFEDTIYIDVKADTLLHVTEPVDVEVPRHEPTVVEKGVWKINTQREYTPQAVRNVLD